MVSRPIWLLRGLLCSGVGGAAEVSMAIPWCLDNFVRF